MKIAFMVGTFPSLSETFILNQITGLIACGHEVDIYANGSGSGSVLHDDVVKYNLLNYTVHFSGAEGQSRSLGNRFCRNIKMLCYTLAKFHDRPKAFIRAFILPDYGQEESTLNLLNKTARVLNDRRYDIVHCHFGRIGISGVILKSIGAIEGKIITTFHGADMSRYIQDKGENVYNYLFEKGDLFLPVSEHWKKKLIAMGCSENKIVVHRMGIDTGKFRYVQRKPECNGKVRIVTVARLVEKKGVAYAIEAVANVLKKYKNVEYRIAGSGPLSKELESLIVKLGIRGEVKLLGRMSQEDIIELMEESDLLLAPSITGRNGDQEGIPVVLMEALAQGMPVISTYHSGIPELIQDGISGLLVPEKDIDALADKISYLIENPHVWLTLGENGRKYVKENHDIEKLNDRLNNIYQKLYSGGFQYDE